jgi:hypothetical protein
MADAAARGRSGKYEPMSFQRLVDDEAVKRLEERYLPSEQQRDYESTFGHANRPQ